MRTRLNDYKNVVVQFEAARQGGLGVAEQIALAVERALAAGELAAGERLPPSRELARQLGVNPLTAAAAYRRLAAAGTVESRVGAGTFITAPPPAIADSAKGTGVALDPVAAAFPLARWRQLMNQVVAQEGAAAFSYDDPGGHPPFKEAVGDYFRGRGIAATPERMVVVSGAQQGLSVLAQALLRRGDWVLVERPTYPGMLRLLQRVGAQIEAVELTPSGPDLRHVERIFQTRPVRLFYTMPAAHAPTGFCHTPATMDALLALCRKHGVTLVEDDAVSDLDYGLGRPSCFAQRMRPDDDVVHLKSFSQLLLPGLRLGVCLAPERTAAVLRQAKQESDLSTSGFFQRVFRQFLAAGWFATWLAALETMEKERFAALQATCAELECVGFQVAPAQAGLRRWLRLPPDVKTESWLAALDHQGILVRDGAAFAPDGAALTGWIALNAHPLSLPDIATLHQCLLA